MNKTEEAKRVDSSTELFVIIRQALNHCPDTQRALPALDEVKARLKALTQECDHLRRLIVARDAADEQRLLPFVCGCEDQLMISGAHWENCPNLQKES